MIVLRQREYGIISNLREKISNRLDMASSASDVKFEEARKFLDDERGIINLDSNKKAKLLKHAKENGVAVVGGFPKDKTNRVTLGKDPRVNYLPGSYYYAWTEGKRRKLNKSKFGQKTLDRFKRFPKVYDQMTQFNSEVDKLNGYKDLKGVIHLNPGSTSDDTLAHELGHHVDRFSKNPVKRVAAKLAPKLSTNFRKIKDIPENRKIIEGLKGLIGSKVVNYNEASASKNGMALLKKIGASPEELKVAGKNLKAAYNTYKYGQNAAYLRLLASGIRPKK